MDLGPNYLLKVKQLVFHYFVHLSSTVNQSRQSVLRVSVRISTSVSWTLLCTPLYPPKPYLLSANSQPQCYLLKGPSLDYTVSTLSSSFMYITATKVSSWRTEPISYWSLPVFPFSLSHKLFLLVFLNDWYKKSFNFISKSQMSKSCRVSISDSKKKQ